MLEAEENKSSSRSRDTERPDRRRHSSYCPRSSKSPPPPSSAPPPSGATSRQYYDGEQQHQSQPRKHSPNCRHERHRRKHHHKHRQPSEPPPQEYVDPGDRAEYESGLYSVDVQYGYNYTRVEPSLIGVFPLQFPAESKPSRSGDKRGETRGLEQ